MALEPRHPTTADCCQPRKADVQPGTSLFAALRLCVIRFSSSNAPTRAGGQYNITIMPRLIRVAAVSDVPPGTAREVMAGDQVVALFNVDGRFYALDGVCPHAGGPLGEGALRGTVVTCPWHGWQFDVVSGENCLN